MRAEDSDNWNEYILDCGMRIIIRRAKPEFVVNMIGEYMRANPNASPDDVYAMLLNSELEVLDCPSVGVSMKDCAEEM